MRGTYVVAKCGLIGCLDARVLQIWWRRKCGFICAAQVCRVRSECLRIRKFRTSYLFLQPITSGFGSFAHISYNRRCIHVGRFSRYITHLPPTSQKLATSHTIYTRTLIQNSRRYVDSQGISSYNPPRPAPPRPHKPRPHKPTTNPAISLSTR